MRNRNVDDLIFRFRILIQNTVTCTIHLLTTVIKVENSMSALMSHIVLNRISSTMSFSIMKVLLEVNSEFAIFSLNNILWNNFKVSRISGNAMARWIAAINTTNSTRSA
jgi:hypothetical protein